MPACAIPHPPRPLGLAALLLLLAAMPVAAAAAEPGADGQVLDWALPDDSESQLFAPIPRWEAPPAPEPVLATPSFMAPTLNKRGAAHDRAVRNGLARPAIQAVPIRRGLAPQATALPAAAERAVGMRLGDQDLSLSTAIVTGQGAWQRQDTRVDWRVERGAGAAARDEVVWSAAAGGHLQASGSAEQTAEAVLGYRLQPLDIVTLTTEIALAGTYSFAAENGLATTMTPRVKVIADLTKPLSMPWRTMLDLSLGRQVPISGQDIQTNAAALLRLELPTP